MRTTEIVGLAAALVGLAGLSVAIIYGKETAAIIGSAGSNFVAAIQAATLQSKPTTAAH